MQSILDKSFKYRNSAASDVRITWRKERERLKAIAAAEAQANIERAEAAAKLIAEQMEQAAADAAERMAKVAPLKRGKS